MSTETHIRTRYRAAMQSDEPSPQYFRSSEWRDTIEWAIEDAKMNTYVYGEPAIVVAETTTATVVWEP